MKGIIERIESLHTPQIPKHSAKALFMDNLERFIRTFSHKGTPRISPIFDPDFRKYGINFMRNEIDKASPKDIQAAIDLSYDFVKRLEENGYTKTPSS